MDQGQMTQIKKMFDIIKASNNPTSMINAMANSNPALKTVLTEVSQSKTSPKDIFYAKAKEKGMNDEQINEFLSSLKSMFNV